MHKPRGFIFDFGETIVSHVLFDPIAGNERILEYAEIPENVSLMEIQQMAEQLSFELNRKSDETMLEFSCKSFQKLLYEYFDIQLRLSAEELEQLFWDSAVVYEPTEEIHELLNVLDTYNISKGILSNSIFSEATISNELTKHGLRERFDFVMSSVDYGLRKPHKYLMETSVKKLGVAPEDVWFAGDKLDYDIQGALNAGIFPIWYNTTNQKGRNDLGYHEVTSWQEVIELITRLYQPQ